MKVLVFNCGSSSIKFQLFEQPRKKVLVKGVVERIGEPESKLVTTLNGQTEKTEVPITTHNEAMDVILKNLMNSGGVVEDIREIGAVGHRVVHGGEAFTGSVLITDEVIASIERFSDLAPLHNPANLSGIRAAQRVLPGVPQIACFDTAFHSTIPPEAYRYALPDHLYERYRIRKYGFHGTSHRFVARRAAQILDRQKYDINCITCHLGNGCSLAAVRNGRSVDTSMGMTPLEGLVMGTRSGDLDPAILFYLSEHGYDTDRLNEIFNKESGLLGISGVSNDIRVLEDTALNGHSRANLALDIFSYRLKKYIGAYIAVLGHVDALIFTGGIGQNATLVRAASCAGLDPLGITLDPRKNDRVKHEGEISHSTSRIKVLVIPTDEESAIASDAYTIAHNHLLKIDE